ncbi:MAG: hypothetical protein AB7V00_01530 [Bacilli bacterium]
MWIDLAGSILGIGLLFFIVNRIIRYVKNTIRAWINIIMGLSLAMIFTIAYLLDYNRETLALNIAYFFYIGASILYGIIGMMVFILQKRSFTKPTSKIYFQEYLYLLYRNQDNLLLFPKKSNKASGYFKKLKKTDFHDDIIKQLNDKWGLKAHIINQGKIILHKEKQIYHGYLLYVDESKNIGKFSFISNKEPNLWPVGEFERELMLRLNLLDPFKIEK